MPSSISQGDVIMLENARNPLLVVSKDSINETGLVMVCPVVNIETNSPIHVKVEMDKVKGEVFCEQLRFFDIAMRHYKKIDAVNLSVRMLVSDIIQGIVDYI